MKNSYCTVCKLKCHYEVHSNLNYIVEPKYVKVKTKLLAKLIEYNTSKDKIIDIGSSFKNMAVTYRQLL